MTDYTLSFSERVKGWVSFKSFIPEQGESVSGNYYTFKHGKIYRHHAVDGPRNTFYNSEFTASNFKVILNEMPGSIKSFKTLNYEGTESRIELLQTQFGEIGKYNTYNADGVTINQTFNSPDYYNLKSRAGWYVINITTDKQKGHINEFIEKEGKWFNYIKGNEIEVNDETGFIDLSGYTDEGSIIYQGAGQAFLMSVASATGCTDPNYIEFNPAAVVPSLNECVTLAVYGCTDNAAFNYDVTANVDDGNCVYAGCTDITASNYDPVATVDDGSCLANIYGCTVSTVVTANEYNMALTWNLYSNYDPANTVNQVSAYNNSDPCIPATPGCTVSTASNYNGGATADDGSCNWNLSGCSDTTACNPLFLEPWESVSDDGSCEYCNNSTADNYDGFPGTTCPDLSGCTFCTVEDVSMGGTYTVDSVGSDSITFSWTTPNGQLANGGSDAEIVFFTVMYRESGNSAWNQLTNLDSSSGVTGFNQYNSPPSGDYSWSYTLGNLDPETLYDIKVGAHCTNTFSVLSSWMIVQDTDFLSIPGCTANNGNVQLTASGTDNSANYATQYPNATPGLTACNWDPLATEDDGSCDFTTCAGCNDINYFEAFDFVADPTGSTQFNWPITDNSQCINSYVSGCTTSGAVNYDPNANFDDGSCQSYVYGCTWGDPNGGVAFGADWMTWMHDTVNGDGSTLFTAGRPNMFDPNATHPCNATNDGDVLNDGGAGIGNNECCEHVGSSNVDEVFACPTVYPELVSSGGIGTTPQSGGLRLQSYHNNMNIYAEISFEFGDSNVGGYISGSNYSNPGMYSYQGTGIRNFGTISRWSLFDIGDANSVASTDPTTGASTRVYDVPYAFITTWNDSDPATTATFAMGPPIPPALDNKVCSE